MKYTMTAPCDNCPFRSDKPFPLSRARVEGIIFNEGGFPCHKTTPAGGSEKGEEVACAGLLILHEKTNGPTQMMRIAERLGLYDHRKLDLHSPVYDSAEECIDTCAIADGEE